MTVLGADRARAPSVNDQALMQAAQTLIQAAPEMQALKGATLSRAELNAGLAETASGYLYLRYDVPNALPQEFWAHWGKQDHLNFHSGQLSVKHPG